MSEHPEARVMGAVPDPVQRPRFGERLVPVCASLPGLSNGHGLPDR